MTFSAIHAIKKSTGKETKINASLKDATNLLRNIKLYQVSVLPYYLGLNLVKIILT